MRCRIPRTTDRRETGRRGLLQTVVVVGLLLVGGVAGCSWRAQALQSDVAVEQAAPAAAPAPGGADRERADRCRAAGRPGIEAR